MSVYFIDLCLFNNFIELCIIESTKPFQPYLLVSSYHQCKECIFQHVNMEKIFYTRKDKYKSIKKFYPELRLVKYQGTPMRTPNNIICPYVLHSTCAYKNALSMCIDYLTFE